MVAQYYTDMAEKTLISVSVVYGMKNNETWDSFKT